MTTSNDILEELKPHQLTRVHGRQPTHRDIEIWTEEAAAIATKIKTRNIQGGTTLGHLAIVIPEEEYQLEIEDDTWTYEEPEYPGAYNPDITGDEDDYIIRRMEAEHKEKLRDYEKYLGVTEHLRQQFEKSIDETWLAPLKKPRGRFANVTIKQFLEHLRTNVTQLTTKQKKDLKKEIDMEWNLTQDINEYFTKMEEKQENLDGWGVQVTAEEMVLAAVTQMQDSNIFESRFLIEWETKPEHEKTWVNMKEYYTKEYRTIKAFGGAKKKDFDTINSVTEREGGAEVSEYFESFRRDAIVGNEQIQQMATSFKGAAETMAEVMERLKTALEEIKTLNKTVETLTRTNATLTNTNKQLSEAIASKKVGGERNPRAEGPGKTGRGTNPNSERCNICGMLHGMPFKDYCWELEANKNKRPTDWTSKL